MSGSNCCVLTCIQVSQEAGKVVWYFHLFTNFPQFVVIYRVKGFSVVSEVDVFLELSCFFNDPTDVGNLISGSSAFSKSSLYIWQFSVHVLLKPSLEDYEHYFASMWNVCSCVVVWTFFGTAPLWDWNESWAWCVIILQYIRLSNHRIMRLKLVYVSVCIHVCLVAQLCPTLCDALGGSLPGSSVHRILQARIL